MSRIGKKPVVVPAGVEVNCRREQRGYSERPKRTIIRRNQQTDQG